MMTIRAVGFLCLLAVINIVGCPMGHAWTAVNGQVTDAEGQSIPEATAILQYGEDHENPWVDETKSDSDGKFRAHVGHAPGSLTLKLKVSKPGYKDYNAVIKTTPNTREQQREIVLEEEKKE